ncbi:MAG: S24/S26 family peptidase [Pseudomonadota bacterium]
MFGWQIVRVAGDSMAPALRHGDYLVGRRTCQVDIGAIVLVRHRELGRIVKRVKAVEPGGVFRIAGDNPASTSEADIGPVSIEDIAAVVRLRISPHGVTRLSAPWHPEGGSPA